MIIMYTVESIEENIVKLEDRKSLIIKEVDKKNLPKNIKEQDILSYKDGKYIIEKKETKKVKKNIEAKFKKLLK